MDIIIRTMTNEDLNAAMALKEAEGWNQTREDWDLFLQQGPEFCLVAIHEGQVVGTVTGISYENKVAWIGMMLVNKAYRGMGISKRLMSEVIRLLDVSSSIKLDATPAGYPVYEKLGFREEFALIRMTGSNVSAPAMAEQSLVVPLVYEHLREIGGLDREVFGADRSAVLSHAFRQQTELAYVYQDPQGVKGYLLARKGTRYTHLGPLVATDASIAKTLLQFAINRTKALPLALDVPISHTNLALWLESCGFKRQRDLYRMYLKGNPFPGIPEQCFLIAGPELG